MTRVMARIVGVYEQVSPAPDPSFRYRLVETMITSDGIRSRLCDGVWDKLEDAQEEMRKRQEKLDARD